jgi:hypothetical protein
VLRQHPVIGRGVQVVVGGCDEIEPAFVAPEVGGALEPAHKEALEQTGADASKAGGSESGGMGSDGLVQLALVLKSALAAHDRADRDGPVVVLCPHSHTRFPMPPADNKT